MDLRTRRVCVSTAGLLSIGLLLWLVIGRDESDQVTSQIVCLGGVGEQCTYYCDSWDPECSNYVSRLDRYCHKSLLTTRWGAEGNITTHPGGFELVYLHIVARHGDRTPATPYRVSPPVESYECGLNDGDPKWSGLSDFQKVPLHSNVENSEIALLPSLHSKECAYGRLTQTGYKQEYALGSLMRRKYAHLGVVDPGEMYVQTTDYPRTIHSAAAFLLGFLPSNSLVRKSTAIHISSSQAMDTPPTGIKRMYSNCNNYFRIWQEDMRMTGYFTEVRRFQPLVERFCDTFNLRGGKEPIACKLFDHLAVRGCHIPYDPLPCNEKGQCVDYTFAEQLSVAADWTWGHKFPRNSSLLALLPFLKHSVFGVMENVMYGEGPNYKLVLTFTHDDVITKLMSILRIPTQEWVPYASRVVFELWRLGSPEQNYYIRVLFNGEAVTNMIHLHSTRTEFERRHNVMTFQSLRDYIMTDKLADVETYHRLCGVPLT